MILATIRGILIFLSLLLVLIPYIICTLFLENTPNRAFAIRRLWVNIALFILGVKIEFKGKKPQGSFLFVCNHRSFSDPLIFAKYLDAYVIAKAEVGDIPLINRGALMTGVLYVKRDSKESRASVRELLVKVLLSDKSVLVYPEGTTNGYKKVMPYKMGTFQEACANNIPVVPTVIEYKDQRDVWFQSTMGKHHFKQFGKWRTNCYFEIGEPLKDKDSERLNEKVVNWTNEKIKAIHEKWGTHYLEDQPS